MQSELLERAELAVRTALEAGATEAEATFSVMDRFGAEARGGAITKLEQSRARSLSVRVFVGKRRGGLSTSDLGGEAIRSAVQRAVAAARHVGDDEFAGLPSAVDEVPAEAKIEDPLALERLIRAGDARIDNSNGSRVDDAELEIALVNSHGFAGSYRSTSVARGTSPVARDGDRKRMASYGNASRSYARLESVEEIARQATHRALAICGARKPKTMTVPVLFERDVAASVLSDLFAAASGANVAVGNSFLADRLGDQIGSDLVTIVDDGRLPRGLGTSPFDSEGTPSRTTVVIDRGRLSNYLFDTYYARKLGAVTTGNASHGGIGPNNFYLQPGAQSLEDLIRSTERGVLVLDTIGFATEHASGTYSRGARGIAIENGELAGPIDEFTIASTIPAMLAAIDGVANDLIFDGAIVSPSFRVAEMTVSGT